MPDGMPPRMVIYRWYAKMYHYSPDVVDRLDLDILTWFPVIEEAESRAQEIIQKQEQAAHNQNYRR